MITDPKTTPDHPGARIGWSMLIAVVAFYLSVFKFINGAPILVLVCMQPVVPILNYFFKRKRFEWNPSVDVCKNEIYATPKLLAANLE